MNKEPWCAWKHRNLSKNWTQRKVIIASLSVCLILENLHSRISYYFQSRQVVQIRKKKIFLSRLFQPETITKTYWVNSNPNFSYFFAKITSVLLIICQKNNYTIRYNVSHLYHKTAYIKKTLNWYIYVCHMTISTTFAAVCFCFSPRIYGTHRTK